MPEVIVLQCDACGSTGKTVTRFTITDAEETREVIFCSEDAKPLRAIFRAGTTPAPPLRSSRGLGLARLMSLHKPD